MDTRADPTAREAAHGAGDPAVWDAIIVGGGAAGLSAGVVLARARFTTLVIDGGAPRNAPATRMHGYLSRDGMPPSAFLATGRAELTRYGGRVTRATVTGARHAPDGTFEPRLSDDRVLRARSVLAATGLTDDLPPIPGLAEGWASTVHHCPHCHGREVADQPVTVIATPETVKVAAHLAALLHRQTPRVTLCLNGATLTPTTRTSLTTYGVRIADIPVVRVTSPPAVRTPAAGDATHPEVDVALEDGTVITCGAVFVAPRPVPHDAILTALGADVDPETGLVSVDAGGATTVPGLWAAGNVVAPRAQVVAAAGAGCTAAIGMSAWLLDRELPAAVPRVGGGR